MLALTQKIPRKQELKNAFHEQFFLEIFKTINKMEKIVNNEEVIDLREYTNTDRKPPVGKRYQTLVDQELVIFDKERPTGREILKKAGKKPPECFTLYLQGKGCAPDRISLDEEVDLIGRGVEIFYTAPPEVFFYDMDDEPETTDSKELTPRQIMVAAGVDPNKHYLVQVNADGSQEKYKGRADEKIKMRCPRMKFFSVHDGPTPLSFSNL